MELLRRWSARLRALLAPRGFDRELRAELEHHVEMETRRRIAEGIAPDEARRSTLRDFGGVQKFREQVHQERWGGGVEALARDARYAARSLLRSPGYATLAVATIALAIAADTAVFSVIRGSLLEPLPYSEPDRLMRVVASWEGQADGAISPAEILDLTGRLEGVRAVGGYSFGGLTLQEGEAAERIEVAVVTSGLLPALGVEPVRGRAFVPDDGFAQDFRLVVTHGFWQRHLGGDPDVVGDTIRVSGGEATILGVLPPDFRMPEQLYTTQRVDALLPNEFDPEAVTDRGSHYLNVVARLADGVPEERAARQLEALAEAMRMENPDGYPADMRFDLRYQPLRERVVGDVRPALLLVGGAVVFILLVACANLAALCLSRYEARHRELALRAALGAGRGRLVTQVLSESLLVGGAGGLLGVALARIGVDALVAASPPDLPRVEMVRLDAPVLLLGFGLSLVAGIGFGLLPALAAGRGRLQEALRGGERGAITLRGERLRQGLVVLQLALAVALLVGAGVLGRSFLALVSADPGYLTSDVVAARVGLPSTSYGSDEARVAFFRTATDSLRRSPGVAAAGAITNLPLATRLGDLNFRLEGVEYGDGEVSPAADWQVVVPGYFEAMGIELLRGRYLDSTDTIEAAGAVVVNETFARTWFADVDPLGRRFELGGGALPAMPAVVGVVSDVRHASVGEGQRPQMYLAHGQFRHWSSGRAMSSLTLVVRSTRPTGEITALMRESVAALDPGLAVHSVASMAEVRAESVARPRFFAALVSLFAAAALGLAAVGIYGVVSYGVAVRRREMGIRMALGAGAASIVRMVVGRSVRLTLVGLALGGVIAAAASRAIAGLLFRVQPLDPLTLATVALVLGSVAVLGSSLPAARAVRSAIGTLLRQE